MSTTDTNVNKAALAVYLTGATRPGGYQQKPSLSLGGYISSMPCHGVTIKRRNPVIKGIRVEAVNAACGWGIAQLIAKTADSLAWIPPDETTESAEVTVNAGETMLIPWTDPAKVIRVTRVKSDLLVAGQIETLWFRKTFNAAAAGSNHIVAAETGAAEYTYTGVILKNIGTAAITNLTRAVLDPAGILAIGTETVVNGGIQTIASEMTAPTGVSFSTSLASTTLAVGAYLGLWLRRTFTPTGTISDALRYLPCGVTITYSCNGVDNLRADIHGLTRHGCTVWDRWELYVGDNDDPDYDAAPAHTHATKTSLTFGPTSASHVYKCMALHRNEFGVRTKPRTGEETVIRTDASNNLLTNPPTGPCLVQLFNRAEGKIMVAAEYLADNDPVTEQANYWAIYEKTDGTDPDPAVDTPTLVAMDGTHLIWTSATHLDLTPCSYLVRTRRVVGLVTSESENTTAYDATASWYPAIVRRPTVTGGRMYGISTSVLAPSGTVYVDQAKNIKFVYTADRIDFYADTVLIWSLREDELKTTFVRQGGAVTGTSSAGVEVGTWTAGEKTIWLAVQVSGVWQRRIKIDVLNGIIYLQSRDGITAITDIPAPVPYWICYDRLQFQAYTAQAAVWKSIMSLLNAALYTAGLSWTRCTTQAACLL